VEIFLKCNILLRADVQNSKEMHSEGKDDMTSEAEVTCDTSVF